MDALSLDIFGALEKKRREGREGTAVNNMDIASALKKTLCIHECSCLTSIVSAANFTRKLHQRSYHNRQSGASTVTAVPMQPSKTYKNEGDAL